MGYRSDLIVGVEEDAFLALNTLRRVNPGIDTIVNYNEYDENMSESPQVGAMYELNSLKWYEGFSDVDQFNHFIKLAGKTDKGFVFRSGEDSSDTESYGSSELSSQISYSYSLGLPESDEGYYNEDISLYIIPKEKLNDLKNVLATKLSEHNDIKERNLIKNFFRSIDKGLTSALDDEVVFIVKEDTLLLIKNEVKQFIENQNIDNCIGFDYDHDEAERDEFGQGDIYDYIDSIYNDYELLNDYSPPADSQVSKKINRGNFSEFKRTVNPNKVLNEFGMTKVLLAARYGAMKTIDKLIERGADLNHKNVFQSDVLSEYLQGALERSESMDKVKINYEALKEIAPDVAINPVIFSSIVLENPSFLKLEPNADVLIYSKFNAIRDPYKSLHSNFESDMTNNLYGHGNTIGNIMISSIGTDNSPKVFDLFKKLDKNKRLEVFNQTEGQVIFSEDLFDLSVQYLSNNEDSILRKILSDFISISNVDDLFIKNINKLQLRVSDISEELELISEKIKNNEGDFLNHENLNEITKSMVESILLSHSIEESNDLETSFGL